MTTASLWSQISEFKPIINDETSISEVQFRNANWTVLSNRSSGQRVRCNEGVRRCLDALDGEKTVAVVFNQFHPDADDAARDAFARSLLTMSNACVLRFDATNDHERLLNLHDLAKRAAFNSRWLNPLMVRIPLHNPSRWLHRLDKLGTILFQRRAFYLGIALMSLALLLACMHASEVGSKFIQLAQSPTHWWLYALLYPCMKLVHELAHALALRRWGGSVYEAGISFLILMPLPYVDASDAWQIENKRKRISVSVAGMMAEGTLASLAFIVWLLVEPGMIKEIAFATAVIGSITTFLFNANPLLRFDGYFILQDALEIPNLGSRSILYLKYLFRRYIVGFTTANSPVSAERERRWFISYSLLSLAYRFIITFSIVVFLINTVPFLGTVMALFSVYGLIFKPCVTFVRYLVTSPELEANRSRVIMGSFACGLITVLVLTLAPLPSSTRAEGIVWVPGQAQIYAPEKSEIVEILVQEGDWVDPGQPLFKLKSPELDRDIAVTAAQIKSLDGRRLALQSHDRAGASALAQDLLGVMRQQAALQRKKQTLDVYALVKGRVAFVNESVAPGAHVVAGAELAYLVDPQALTVKAVIEQDDVARINSGIEHANVRLAERFDETLDAVVRHEVPTLNHRLPSMALAYDGNGGIAMEADLMDASDVRQGRTAAPVLHLELDLPALTGTVGIGGRAYVRLDHEPESLGTRVWRSARQLLLRRLAV